MKVTQPDVRALDAVEKMLVTPTTKPIPPMARFALVQLAYRMWKTGTTHGADRYCAFPSIDRLALEMGCARSTVKVALKHLREVGLLSIERGGGAPRVVKGLHRTRTHVFRLGPEAMRFIERCWPDAETEAAPKLRAVGR